MQPQGTVKDQPTVGDAPANPADCALAHGLTPKEEAYARALVETGNRSLAYRRAYKPAVTAKPGSIWAMASEIAQRPRVGAFIRQLQEAAAAKTTANKAQLIQFLWDRIMADRRELMQHHKYNCRYCHGQRGQWQWKDDMEYAMALAAAIDANSKLKPDEQKALPTDEGGYGFNPHADPNPGCEHDRCMGHGIERTVFADTSSLTGAAALCYEGMKVTAQGIEMKIADRATDIAQLAKLLGWSVDKVKDAADAPGAIGGRNPEDYDIPSTATPEEAAKRYLALVS